MLPSAFASSTVARRLNSLAVGLALSAAPPAYYEAFGEARFAIDIGGPLLVVGLLWAWVMRERSVGPSGVRGGWFLSAPLAVLCAALSGAASHGYQRGAPLDSYLSAMMRAPSEGFTLWVPVLGLTLLIFGGPISWGHHEAKKGLAGADRGERILGIVCASVALAALAMSFEYSPTHTEEAANAQFNLAFTRIVALLGLLCGAAAAVLSQLRETNRAAFVAEAEEGRASGFRVDTTPEGKALVRVSSVGEGYRAAEIAESVVLLDEEGRAVESRFVKRG